MDAFSRLVIPRIRLLCDDAERVRRRSEDNQPSKSIRYQGVVWHRRRLPEGWWASPAAREMAETIGITLKDNETFVRDHHRGTKKIAKSVH